MKNLKKVLAGALAVIMAMSLMTGAFAADFTDAADIDKTEAAAVMDATGIMIGLPDGSFDPDGILNREQAAKMIAYLTLGVEKAEKLAAVADFADVPATNWATSYIAYAAAEGIISGYAGKFYPTDELDGYAYGKMILVALGFDAEENGLVGDNWTTNVRKLLVANDLLANMDDVVFSEGLSREDAAQLTLNAALNTATPETWDLKDNTGAVIGTYATLAEANKDKALMTSIANSGAPYTVVETPKTDCLLADVFGIIKGSDTDSSVFGRPGVSYELNDDANTVLYFSNDPVKTYTTGFNADELAALKKAKYDFSQLGADDIVVNGSAPTGGNAIADIDALAAREYTGTVIELYASADDAKVIEKVVVVQGYLTEVTGLTTGYEDPTKNSITLSVYNPWDADDIAVRTYADTDADEVSIFDKLVAEYAKDDIMITYWEEGDPIESFHDLICAEKATTQVATVTATKYDTTYFNGTFVAGGKTYTLASAYAEKTGFGGALTLGDDYTLYLDANGYVIGAVPVAAAVADVYYGIVLDYAWDDGVPASNMTGAAATVSYEKVKLFTEEGAVTIFDTAYEADADDAITTWIAKDVIGDGNSLDSSKNGLLVKYTLDANGKIDSFVAADKTAGLTSHTKGSTFKVDASGSVYATTQTVVFIMETGTVTGEDDIVVYTGYANVPEATYTAGDALVADADAGEVGAVSVTIATIPGSTTAAQYVVLTDAPTVTAGVKEGEVRWTYDVILDGVATKVYAEGTSGALASIFDESVGELCTITFDAATGYVAELTAVSPDVDEIVSVNDGFYNDDALVYTDANTVYYQLTAKSADIAADSIANITGFAATEGITLAAPGQTFKVLEYVIDGTGSVAEPIDIVFYFVYQP